MNFIYLIGCSNRIVVNMFHGWILFNKFTCNDDIDQKARIPVTTLQWADQIGQNQPIGKLWAHTINFCKVQIMSLGCRVQQMWLLIDLWKCKVVLSLPICLSQSANITFGDSEFYCVGQRKIIGSFQKRPSLPCLITKIYNLHEVL